jgi:hypothetical protein
MTNVEQWSDYVYAANVQDMLKVGVAVLICPPENHNGKFGHALYGGGNVMRLPPEQIKALVAEPWCIHTPGQDSVGGFTNLARTSIIVRIPERFQRIYSATNDRF